MEVGGQQAENTRMVGVVEFGVVGPPLGGRLVGEREGGHATILEEGPRGSGQYSSTRICRGVRIVRGMRWLRRSLSSKRRPQGSACVFSFATRPSLLRGEFVRRCGDVRVFPLGTASQGVTNTTGENDGDGQNCILRSVYFRATMASTDRPCLSLSPVVLAWVAPGYLCAFSHLPCPRP